MRLLAIDIGNSKLAAALIEHGEVHDHHRSVPLREAAAGKIAEAVAQLYDWCVGHIQSGEPIPRVAVTSVVPTRLQLWQRLWVAGPASREVPTTLIDHTTPFPFEVEIAQPETVGADRYCNVAGAMARGHRSALVVDLGTANTYDLLLDGRFLGGLIGPGILESHEALLRAGAQLPSLPFRRPRVLIGTRTEEAILSGSFHQGVGGVAYVVDRVLREHPWISVMLTGGVAETLEEALPFRGLFCPYLTLEGAAWIGMNLQTRVDAGEA